MSNTATYRISAHDLLFFGTGRPFTMEDESWTLGIFPPYPATLYGFLRTIYFENNMDELSKATKENDPTKNLKILDYHLELESDGKSTPLYSLPNCFLKTKKEEENSKSEPKPEKLDLEPTKNIISNYPFTHVLKSSKGKKEGYGPLCFVSKEDLQKFLNGEEISTVIDLSELMESEDRISISKNRYTGLAEDGKLFRVQFAHTTFKENEILKKIHFNITISGLQLPDKSHGRRLGGEGKIAFLEKIDKSENNVNIDFIANENPTVIYIQTPCIVNSIDDINVELNESGYEVSCISNNGFDDIGGWDIQKKVPKKMEAALPAGSLVFIEKNESWKDDESIKKLKTLGNETKQGFGKILLGTY